jgi:hypothetical protein
MMSDEPVPLCVPKERGEEGLQSLGRTQWLAMSGSDFFNELVATFVVLYYLIHFSNYMKQKEKSVKKKMAIFATPLDVFGLREPFSAC